MAKQRNELFMMKWMAMNQFIYSETPERVEILKWNLKFRVVVSEMDWVWARLRRLRRDERLNWLQVVSYKGYSACKPLGQYIYVLDFLNESWFLMIFLNDFPSFKYFGKSYVIHYVTLECTSKLVIATLLIRAYKDWGIRLFTIPASLA